MDKNAKMLKKVRVMADYQFGKGCGNILFPDDVTFQLSRTKRIRQIMVSGKRIATVRAKDGTFTLSMDAATAIHDHTPAPGSRVVVCDDAVPFVSKGKTTFAKHVTAIDPGLRSGDEVIVVDENDTVIATGQLMLSPEEVEALDTGAAVDVRCGCEQ
ncbi:pseudouridine synthase [Methanococcoides sp. SA1]|nr:pseudouridine synthase [Methanococcoides sp. SA1]NPE31045.1 pseudouridine synthase [Methanococcoides sp. SA1]